MKAWWAKLRISAALDGCRGLAVWPHPKARVSDELRDFDRDMSALDRALRRTAPKPHAPSSLHGSIMRAVQAAQRPSADAQREWGIVRWLPVPVVLSIALMVMLHPRPGPGRLSAQATQPLAVASAALRVGDEMARSVPSAVVTPLADELQKLNQDLNNTAQFLLASLP